jgi:Domain of unknown function DUF29
VSTAERIPGRLYDRDFYEWTNTTAQLLRAGRLSEVDAAAAAEIPDLCPFTAEQILDEDFFPAR